VIYAVRQPASHRPLLARGRSLRSQARLFALVCGFQVASGGPNLFFDLTALAALLCVILAVRAWEHPTGRSLTYWDEAVVFGLISQLG
jgi:hypothetical protein